MVSCLNREAGDSLSIPYVRDILSDTTSVLYRKIEDGCPDRKNGTIAIAGPEKDVFSIADELMSCDYFDNVDGRMQPDGLPDFAGETLALLCDNANEPYHGYLDNGNEGYLKELTVKNFLSAIDTTCALNPFDRKTTVHKSGSKIVILASSYSSAFGYSDIMRLLDSAKPDVAVISPVHSMFRYAIRRHAEKGSFAVWTTGEILGAGVYSTVWSELVKDYPSLVYEAFCPSEAGSLRDRIITFLRMYKVAGHDDALDAAIVDDKPLRADELNSALKSMIDSQDDSLAVYRDMISDKFEFIDAEHAVVSDCIAFLREKNLFTHQVAYPSMSAYSTVPVSGMAAQDYNADGSFTDKFKYNRAENSDFATFILMEKSITQEEGNQYVAGDAARKTFDGYVSK